MQIKACKIKLAIISQHTFSAIFCHYTQNQLVQRRYKIMYLATSIDAVEQFSRTVGSY